MTLNKISGFNDVSWHNRDILTPNMDALVKGGIALEQNYVQPICTPTRSALMTGYYPIHTGRQARQFLCSTWRISCSNLPYSYLSTVLSGCKSPQDSTQTSPLCQSIFRNWVTAPTQLESKGSLIQLTYQSGHAGYNFRWHLGYCNETFLPTRRGFESHKGFWGGSEDYYAHSRSPTGNIRVERIAHRWCFSYIPTSPFIDE